MTAGEGLAYGILIATDKDLESFEKNILKMLNKSGEALHPAKNETSNTLSLVEDNSYYNKDVRAMGYRYVGINYPAVVIENLYKSSDVSPERIPDGYVVYDPMTLNGVGYGDNIDLQHTIKNVNKERTVDGCKQLKKFKSDFSIKDKLGIIKWEAGHIPQLSEHNGRG